MTMHRLMKAVVGGRDLSLAGELFALSDAEVVGGLAEALSGVAAIAAHPDFERNDNDQSVVEIVVTRVTACLRDARAVREHAAALLELLHECLRHRLQAREGPLVKEPPHAKIAADLVSCLFRQYRDAGVMELALPAGVRLLRADNEDLSADVARYLALAAVHHPRLLRPHAERLLDSLLAGNRHLCRLLGQLYEVAPRPLDLRAPELVELLRDARPNDRRALVELFLLMADGDLPALHGLPDHLCPPDEPRPDPDCGCVPVLEVLLRVARRRPRLLLEHAPALRRSAASPHATPKHALLVAQILAAVGRLDGERAQDALDFVLDRLASSDRSCHAALLKEATALCRSHPALFTDGVLHYSPSPSRAVTVVRLGDADEPHPKYTRRAKLGDSRSTGRLHAPSNAHRSTTRLNAAGGSVGGLHKSLTRLSSSQQIDVRPPPKWSAAVYVNDKTAASSGGVTVTTASPLKIFRHGNAKVHPIHRSGHAVVDPGADSVGSVSPSRPIRSVSIASGKSTDSVSARSPAPSVSVRHSNMALGSVSVVDASVARRTASPVTVDGASGSDPAVVVANGTGADASAGPVTVTSRRANNTSVTMINPSQRISVFEPYPMRDTVQHFCEKHLDKIKSYMDKASLRIPPPFKCIIEERRAKKLAKLLFACQARGQHCLYSRTYFTMRTRNPRTWIHLMFLALQARSSSALSSRDSSVSSLKHCWDILKCENKTFLTLVTSAFPGSKDQEMVLNELRQAGFFDVFELTPAREGEFPIWGCFLCNHPEKAVGFLNGNTQPVIEGQLKEKKGRWRLFRRWRTRYFTLSGAHLSCKGSSGGESIDINQIRSVKVSRGARNIPKAFEIFTGDQTLILKPKDGKNAEEWVQCLSIVVAHSQARDAPAKTNSLPARGISLKNI